MANCTRHDISAKLAAALSSEEFPEDNAAIEEHLSTCGPCREELHALRLLDGFLREHKDNLGRCSLTVVPPPTRSWILPRERWSTPMSARILHTARIAQSTWS